MNALKQIVYLMSNSGPVNHIVVVAGETWRTVLPADFTLYCYCALVLEGVGCSADAAVFCSFLQGADGTAW